MKEVRFTKMHGIGNDYIYINCLGGFPPEINDMALRMSDRHRGVGSDGIIAIGRSDVADFRMRMFNSDGTEGRMCGNGARCVGKYVYDKGLTDKTEITLETLGGIKVLRLHLGDEGKVDTVTVDMGVPELEAAAVPVVSERSPMIDGVVPTSRGDVFLTAVSMGNPHGVVFVDSLDDVDVHGLGRELENHPIWPDRSNIEFAEVVSPSEVKMRVWERGSGETMACGTGSCATVVAGVVTGRTERRVKVRLLGGDLDIEWNPDDGHVYMTGPAATVFEGVCDYEMLRD